MCDSPFRNNLKNYYKASVRSTIEQSVLNVLHKYEDIVMTSYYNDSLRYDLNQILSYYIDACGMDNRIVYEVYKDIIDDYNNQHNLVQDPSFVEESIQHCIDKYDDNYMVHHR